MTEVTGRKAGTGKGPAGAIAAAPAVSVTGGAAGGAAGLDQVPYGTAQGRQAVEIFTITDEHGLRAPCSPLLGFRIRPVARRT